MRPRDALCSAAALVDVEKTDEKRCAELNGAGRGGWHRRNELSELSRRECAEALRCRVASVPCVSASVPERAGIFFWCRGGVSIHGQIGFHPATLEAVSFLDWGGMA